MEENHINYVCHEVLVALAFLHEKQILHRDIKAENILINDEGLVKLGG